MSEEHLKSSNISFKELNVDDLLTREQIDAIQDEILEQQEVVVLWADKPLFTIGAMDGQQIAGLVQVAESGHVNYLVHPSYQQRGIATELLRRAIAQARKGDTPTLYATVKESSASEKVVLSQGFDLDESIAEEGYITTNLYSLRLQQ